MVSYTGEVQNVNQQFRNSLDLFGITHNMNLWVYKNYATGKVRNKYAPEEMVKYATEK